MTKTFWSVLSDYTSELAPVAGPLLTAVADTAAALDRAGTTTRALQASSAALHTDLLGAIDVTPTPRVRRRRRIKAAR